MNDTNVLSYCSMNLSLPGLSLAHQLYVAVKVCLLELELLSIPCANYTYGFVRHKDTAEWVPRR